MAFWPGRLYGVDFFEKSLEIRDSIWSGIDENWSELGSVKGFGEMNSGKWSGKRGERHGMGFGA